MYPIGAAHGNRSNWLKRERDMLVPVTDTAVKYFEGSANGKPFQRIKAYVMIVGRIISWLFALAAVFAAARDVVAWIDTGAFRPMPLGQLWFDLHNGSLNLVQAVVQRYILPELWDPVIVTVLLAPAWFIFAVPAIILLVLCRKRR